MNNSQRSFSHEINQLVVAGFGIAFFLMFCACALLLYLTENDHRLYVPKVLGILAIYLVLYIFYSLFIVNRIKKLFLPLDRIATGILHDQVFIDNGEKDLKDFAQSLREQALRMEELNKKLKVTRQQADEVSKESAAGRETMKQRLAHLCADVEKIKNCGSQIKHINKEIGMITESTLSAEKEIAKKREGIEGYAKILEEQISDNLGTQADTEDEFIELGESYVLLDNVYTEASSLIDSIYDEMMSLQTLASQMNLLAMNAALDITRNGSITVSSLTTLDEIKLLSTEINDKSDNVLLLIIRARNSLKLAVDQSGECRDRGAECRESFSRSREYLEKLGKYVKELSMLSAAMSDDALNVTAGVSKIKQKQQLQSGREDMLCADIDRIGERLNKWNKEAG